jgi:D-alanyl-D-alanine carboxypeptidase
VRKKRTSVGRVTTAIVLVATVCAVVGGALLVQGARSTPTAGTSAAGHGPRSPGASGAATDGTSKADPETPFDRSAHSTTDPESIWVIVNKTHPITPSDYRPEISLVRGYQVATPAAEPLTRLLDDGDRQGLGFKIASAFRSYDYQLGVHQDTVAARGEAEADRISARAGYSEHQTGLAVDLVTPDSPACDFDACFADTPGGRWLAREAWRYGFIIRYLPDNEAKTGYASEPWHLRYVGPELAAELRETRVSTLEEFFGVHGGNYPDL